MSAKVSLLAGVELGGTKCICVLGTAEGAIDERVRIETGDPAETLEDIGAVLSDWKQKRGFDALGIASFGPLDFDRTSATFGSIVSTPKPGWSEVAVLASLNRFGVATAIDTDVNASGLAEWRWGAGRGLDNFAYVTVGTGIGVGIIVDGRPLVGRGHPEIGHLRVPRLKGDDWPGSCPYHGDCAEGLASGAAIAARHGPGVVPGNWPGWESVEFSLAMLLHNLFVTIQPRTVLVGGGVIHSQPHLLDRVRVRLTESLGGYHTAGAAAEDPALIQMPSLGTDAGPAGSLALALLASGS